MSRNYEIYRYFKESEHQLATTTARTLHWAMGALLEKKISIHELNEVIANSGDTLRLDDRTGHVGSIEFDPTTIAFWLGASHDPQRVYLPRVPDSPRQYTFRLDALGVPEFEISLPTNDFAMLDLSMPQQNYTHDAIAYEVLGRNI